MDPMGRHRRYAAIAYSALVIGACLVFGWPRGLGESAHLDALYELKAWWGQTREPYRTPLAEWQPDVAALQADPLAAETPRSWKADAVVVRRYGLLPANAPGRTVWLKLAVAPTVKQAQAYLIHGELQPGHALADAPYPTLDDLGDRAYMHPHATTGMVFFVRNNMAVKLFTLRPEGYSVLELARALDRQILEDSRHAP